MPRRTSKNADLWNFPGGISDWLGTGHRILQQIRIFDGKLYDTTTQIAFMQALRNENITTAMPNAIQGRKILNSFAKVGLIDTISNIHITRKGIDFLNANTEQDKRFFLRKACESIEFWNPVETSMSHSFNVRPYPVVLYLMTRLGYLSNKEIEKHVLRIKYNGQIEPIIQNIKNDRASSATYVSSIDERNRASWMMSLFGNTDLVRHLSGKIYLDNKNVDKIISIVKPLVPDVESILEKEVDREINSEIGSPYLSNMDTRLGELLARKSNPTHISSRVVRRTNLYKREIELANLIKKLYDFRCQICGVQLKKAGWRSNMLRKLEWDYLYAETAHIKEISNFPQYDVKENMLCLCPNCHKNLDNKVYKLSKLAGVFICTDSITKATYTITVKAQHGLKLFT